MSFLHQLGGVGKIYSKPKACTSGKPCFIFVAIVHHIARKKSWHGDRKIKIKESWHVSYFKYTCAVKSTVNILQVPKLPSTKICMVYLPKCHYPNSIYGLP